MQLGRTKEAVEGKGVLGEMGWVGNSEWAEGAGDGAQDWIVSPGYD